jgi:UDP-galactopyranose mutase
LAPNAAIELSGIFAGTKVAQATFVFHRGLPEQLAIICLSHLRWSFVYQRPQHLLSRYATTNRVFYVEEPLRLDIERPDTTIEQHDGVTVVVPRIPSRYSDGQVLMAQRALLDRIISEYGLSQFIVWYYTPAALPFSDHLTPAAVVYDCMDELAAFQGAAANLPKLERALMRRADVMFTGGHSLYEVKRALHSNIHALPSSVDVSHFAQARTTLEAPLDQAMLATPRLGFFGVLDERLDVPLLHGIADARPDWQFVMIGPVVKIDPAVLPRRPNIHYLGPKTYAELPVYIAGWDVALILFARNEATRFISPTKTPEYLAAGKPVVSTSITDVVRTYERRDLVRIADSVEGFVEACERALAEPPETRRARADSFLQRMSWDRTWQKSARLLNAALDDRTRPRVPRSISDDASLGA